MRLVAPVRLFAALVLATCAALIFPGGSMHNITTTPADAPRASAPPLDAIDAKIARFLRDELADGAHRFELRHLSADGSEQRVRPFAKAEESSPLTLGSAILEAATDDARGLRGVNAYAVLAFHPGAPSAQARCMIRIQGDDECDGLEPTERPGILGALAMQMRHNETNQRLAVNASLDVVRFYRSALQERAEYVHRLEAKHLAVLDLLETLGAAKAAQDMEQRRETRKEHTEERVIAQLEKYLPDVAGRLFGGGELAALRKVVHTITNEQLGAMLEPLTLPQREAMTIALTAIFEQEMAKQPKANGAPPPNGAPPTNGAPS